MRLYLFPLPGMKDEHLPILVRILQEIENVINGNLEEDNLRAGSLSAAVLKEDTIRWTVDIPIVTLTTSVDAASVGIKVFDGSTVMLDADTLRHAKAAKLIIDYDWATSADGTFELYDQTADKVLGQSTVKTSSQAFEWEEFVIDVKELKSSHIMVIRANITVAGASGDLVRLHRAFLRLTLGVS